MFIFDISQKKKSLFLTCWMLELNHLYIWEFQVEVSGMGFLGVGAKDRFLSNLVKLDERIGDNFAAIRQ